MKYYGVMCCELTGSLDDLECEADYKPTTEYCGFSFAKWAETIEKRDKIKEYLRQEITKIQEAR